MRRSYRSASFLKYPKPVSNECAFYLSVFVKAFKWIDLRRTSIELEIRQNEDVRMLCSMLQNQKQNKFGNVKRSIDVGCWCMLIYLLVHVITMKMLVIRGF